jgi:hypothetical protein
MVRGNGPAPSAVSRWRSKLRLTSSQEPLIDTLDCREVRWDGSASGAL